MKHFYAKNLIVLIVLFSFASNSYAQKGKNFWRTTSKAEVVKGELTIRKSEPVKSAFFKLDISGLKAYLSDAPKRFESNIASSKFMSFPTSDGTLEVFDVMEASMMEPELQQKYSNITTYVGQSIENPVNTMRFSITPQGLHTISFNENVGMEYIDPYTKSGENYIVYAKKDLPILNQNWTCDVIDDAVEVEDQVGSNRVFNANDGIMRDFRLALACTIEYAAFHWMAAGIPSTATEATKRAAVLAAMVVTINRNNFIYERDLSVTMTLVANNESIIFIDSDNFTNNDSNDLIDESQAQITALIGSANFDIGHTFSTGGGGLAQLNSPCNTNTKARGITGLPNPVGDAYDIDFVAHELGHQFGAPHTFNGDSGNCAGNNRTASNAYEPGSGSTIMAYAGICAPQNVQSNSDAYFHQKSLQMIWDNISSGVSQCATQIATGNSAPTAEAGLNYVIPKSTPFKLTGTSTDVDGTTSHTYTWEQYDLGAAGLPLETNTTGPLVRSFEGTSNATRFIPRLVDVVSNGGVSTTWEKLASVGRTENFRLTVRDNDPNGGQTAVDNMIATVDDTDGPFLVTSQNASGLSWSIGSTQTITWDVAGTAVAPGVNTPNVNILLSTDGGVTFDTVLATNVANDGSHDIIVPNVQASFCRIMVEGAGNIFFNVNTSDFSIGTTVTTICTTYSSAQNLGLAIPDGAGTTAAPVAGTPLFNSIDISDSNTISSITITADVTHPNTGEILLQFQHPDVNTNDAFVNVWIFDCNGDSLSITFDDAGAPINCGSPTTGTFAPVNSLGDIFNGLNSAGGWNLAVVDFVSGNTGTLNNWSIEICETTVLSVDQFDLANNISVYPNPNNGEFSIKFNDVSGDVDVEVFDIRGRSILQNKYSKITGDFNKSLNLGDVESGIYLLNIKNNGRTITKKIVVE
ncbi:zinc-dependent metalloprotease [Olleya sp. HaHaR_3_96]|uniref:zinc-dependent metalloprotease n=1 Tax=Olleya sp. HaHaR_3_96 TaxID=2745560 RepID=UPI001C5005C9|nr:zinc-dependent metalloprotease [Olleya sp. HaHaR_3_96]QXP60555.1 T9SS type A sorting domain-containing protein [Olleya sp. HaHaR_3_96]